MAPRLYIVVFKGDPVDLQKTRHTALFISEDDQRYGDLLHVTGAAGTFGFERRQQVDPAGSRTFIKKIAVGPLTNGPTKQQLISRITATPINNSTRSWNCQNWVGDALVRVVQGNWISSKSKSDAISAMADVIIEAEDEEE